MNAPLPISMALDRDAILDLILLLRNLGLTLLRGLLPPEPNQAPSLSLPESAVHAVLQALSDRRTFWKTEPAAYLPLRKLVNVIGARHRGKEATLGESFRLFRFYLAGLLSRSQEPRKRAKWVSIQTARALDHLPGASSDAFHWSVVAGDLIKLHHDAEYAGLPPESVWEAIADAAWSDPAFRRESAGMLLDFLRPRMILDLAERPIHAPNPRLIWCLIATAATPQPDDASQRQFAEAWRRLQRVADALADAPGWAGFWDQWLMYRAHRCSDRDLTQEAPDLERALAELPAPIRLHKMRLAQKGKERPADTSPHEGQATESPVQEQPEPNQRDDPGEARRMAAVDWEAEMPAWVNALAEIQ